MNVARNAALTCDNANVLRVATRLSPWVRARGTPLASEHAGGGQTLRAASAKGLLWTSLGGRRVSITDEQRVTVAEDWVQSCVVCGSGLTRLQANRRELCNACLYLCLFRERYSRTDTRFSRSPR